MPDQPNEPVVEIYTDGACSGNPGPGGWGAVLRYRTYEEEMFGCEPAPTTNNRMELMGAIKALERLAQPTTVRLHTDSTYVQDGITKWLARWKRNGWQTTSGQPVKNVDLWRRLDAAVQAHVVQWHWVKGHAGHPDNERADQLAAEGLGSAFFDAPVVRRSVSRTGLPSRFDTAVRTTDGVAKPPEGCQVSTSGDRTDPLLVVPSGPSEVHDHLTQCGVEGADGQPCGTVTGGGPCALHQSGAHEELMLF